jgi:hypothetical protein
MLGRSILLGHFVRQVEHATGFAFLSTDFLVSDDKLVAWESASMAWKLEDAIQASPMALVARILLLPDEPEHGHNYGVTVINPDGEEKVLCENEPLSTKHHSAGQPSASNLIVSLTIFYLSTGFYRFQLIVDGDILKEIPLRVSHDPALAANVSLTEGVVNA